MEGVSLRLLFHKLFNVIYFNSYILISLTFIQLIHELVNFFNSNFLYILLTFFEHLISSNSTIWPFYLCAYTYINRYTLKKKREKEIYIYRKIICFVNLMALLLLLFLGMSISYYECKEQKSIRYGIEF